MMFIRCYLNWVLKSYEVNWIFEGFVERFCEFYIVIWYFVFVLRRCKIEFIKILIKCLFGGRDSVYYRRKSKCLYL